ncbi:MAG: hypothetical protein JOY86_08615 [Candidatus Eremiobacteraeota bacterium]|nr:hypothetical protein [Candidatus Eremiobacteraeota bacterium]
MLGAALALAWTLASAAPVTASTSPTPVPNGIHATFVALAEKHGAAYVTFAIGTMQQTMRLAADALVQERAVGGSWKPIDPASLRPGAPLVVFERGGQLVQIDTLYAEIATRFVLVKNDYGVAPSGAIYHLVGKAAVIGAGLPSGTYVLLRVAPGTTTAFDLAASTTPFSEASQLPRVYVTIDVLVPLNTPSTDVVYMSTDALSWTPNAVRMAPLPGNRWTVTLSLTQGTQIKYKYTRGTWTTDEVDLAGNEIANRTLTVVAKGAAQKVEDSVARWADKQS